MTKLKMIGLYLALGPLLGGVAVFVVFVATFIIPDLLADPANLFGHNRWQQFWGLLALCLLYSYPFGLFSALAAGLAHIKLQSHFLRYRKSCIALVGIAGWLALAVQTWAMQSFAIAMLAAEVLWVPWVSAGIMSVYISRRTRERAKQAA